MGMNSRREAGQGRCWPSPLQGKTARDLFFKIPSGVGGGLRDGSDTELIKRRRAGRNWANTDAPLGPYLPSATR